jgi:hypothetical protein
MQPSAQTMPYPGSAPPPPAAALQRHGVGTAHFLLWFCLWFFALMVGIGLTFDRWWHATHKFDTFFSPPHVFTYTMVAISAILFSGLVFNGDLRQWFGPTLRLPVFPFPVPAAQFIVGAGFVTLLLAGCLDAIWHSNFGLDETGWTTPHAMIGWGILMIFFGFVACHLAMRPVKPLRWYAVLTLGYFALTVSLTPFLGPLHENISPDTVRALSNYPILLAQPPAEHTFRIYLAWNLTRANPIFIPLVTLWAGAALAFVRQLDRRLWMLPLLLGIALVTGVGGDRNLRYLQSLGHIDRLDIIAQPLPLLIPGLIFALLVALRTPERVAWGVFGLIFGFFCAAIWIPDRQLMLPLALVAVPFTLCGSWLGEGAFSAIANPAKAGRAAIVLAGVSIPFLTGIFDLYFRSHTP